MTKKMTQTGAATNYGAQLRLPDKCYTIKGFFVT